MSTGLAMAEVSLGTIHQLAAHERCPAVLMLVLKTTGEARQTVLRVGAELIPEEVLAALLADEADDVARNAGLEMLKLRGRRAFNTAVRLLSDPDDDVIMQGVQLVEATGDPRGWPAIRPLLGHANVNVVQAVIAAAPSVGSQTAALDLVTFLEGDPWLQVAAIESIGRLRARPAVSFLRPLLLDPLAGDFAADALARIGGIVATKVLVRHFLVHRAELDAERWLGLLGSVLSDLERPLADSDLRDCLALYLRTRLAAPAAACLLALGPGTDDVEALAALAAAETSAKLPLSLRRRVDLLPLMLMAQPPACYWGLELARYAPETLPGEVLERALIAYKPDDTELVAALARLIGSPRALVELFAAFSADVRPALHDAIRANSTAVAELIDVVAMEVGDRILLRELTGESPAVVAEAVAALEADGRADVIPQLQTAEVVDRLPWARWMDEEPRRFVPFFAEAAGRFKSCVLLALLREVLARAATPALLKAAGGIGDPATVPLLIQICETADLLNRAFAFEALGEIGGDEATAFLRAVTFGAPGSETRVAARAFARCAGRDDVAGLERLTLSEDWAVRLAAAEALGRVEAAGSPAIQALLADPSPVVARKACALIAGPRRDA